MNRTITTILIFLVLGFGAYYLLRDDANNGLELGENGTTTGARAEENSVIVVDQRPGREITVSQVYLATPGYVAIHDATGTILGSSKLLQAGENNNVKVPINRTLRENEELRAELHAESNNNTTFEASADTSIQSSLDSGPIRGIFNVSSDTTGTAPVLP